MEEVYKKKDGSYWSMKTGRPLNSSAVHEIGPFCWHGHPEGPRVLDVAESDCMRKDEDTYKDDYDKKAGY